MKKIRVAQIGIGHDHAPGVFADMAAMTDVYDIVGWHIPEEERTFTGKNMKGHDAPMLPYPHLSLEEILNDSSIDAVVVETEERFLTKYAMLAIEHGKHVHMDKPGGFDIREFDALVSAAEAKGLTFHLGYMYRYYPPVQDLIARAKAGEFGKVLSVEGQMNCWHAPEKRQWVETLPGGNMYLLGCHMLDLVLQIMGEPQEVRCLNHVTERDGTKAVDYAMAMLEYPIGPSFIKSCDTERGGFGRRQLVLCCETCTVELKPMELLFDDDSVEAVTTVFKNGVKIPGASEKCKWYGRSEPMMRAFAQIVAGERENDFSCDYERMLYKTLLKCCGREE